MTIPNIIHYIWLGSELKSDYLTNIHRMCAHTQKLNPQWKVCLWVDHPRNYELACAHYAYRSATIDFDLACTQPKNLTVRNIYDLPHLCTQTINTQIDQASRNDFHNKISKIFLFLGQEMTGLVNYAAASDILRYLILFCEGGYYIDTDLKPILKSTFQPTAPIVIPAAQQTTDIDFRFLKLSSTVNNCFLASQPTGPFIQEALFNMFDVCKDFYLHKAPATPAHNLNTLREEELVPKFPIKKFIRNETALQVKRLPEYLGKSHPTFGIECMNFEFGGQGLTFSSVSAVTRLTNTLEWTGPGIVVSAVSKYLDNQHDFFLYSEKNKTYAYLCGDLFLEYQCDNTWLQSHPGPIKGSSITYEYRVWDPPQALWEDPKK